MAGKKKSIFVIQKHDASHLHYDFRIEFNRVLKSWAVPKGPSTNPKDKRLAVSTTDHKLSYANFEGLIPSGEYGAGTVMVWDIGTYKNIKEKDGKIVPMSQCLKDGSIEIWLEGKKLKGGYALVKMKGRGDNNWLLIKMKDEYADVRRNIAISEPDSVLTNRSLEQIAKDFQEK